MKKIILNLILKKSYYNEFIEDSLHKINEKRIVED